MTDVATLLVTLQLTDSAFPAGFYTLSHGLEGYAQSRAVTPDTLPELLADLLRHSIGPADATAVALAHAAIRRGDHELLHRVDRRLHATKLNRELRRACIRTGHQLLSVGRQTFAGEGIERFADDVAAKRTPGTQPVTTGVIAASCGVAAAQAVAGDLFAFSASLVGAALRLRLTDHIRAQRILADAGPVIEEVAAAALRRDLDDLGGCTPVADVMSAGHERADARLFVS
ncbi:urease accessory protein UreF [Rhodococcus sp. SGAir0479]|uniref:urease accessory protein UreF n=1 Tax=Rhodococcus sp. SGAir0479 TaxID=2567884 RepID=UPI0010CD1996|nr:urease accessory UreF family protein [Rhodococcus sp. SGAir0479]QCQ94029.1 urease accessory protein [Rhodococcus sp. SGAir0479]